MNDGIRNDERFSFISGSKTIHGETMKVSIGDSGVQALGGYPYHPGKQVTLPKRDSKALAR